MKKVLEREKEREREIGVERLNRLLEDQEGSGSGTRVTALPGLVSPLIYSKSRLDPATKVWTEPLKRSFVLRGLERNEGCKFLTVSSSKESEVNIPAYVYFWNRVNGSEDSMVNKIDRKKMMSRIIVNYILPIIYWIWNKERNIWRNDADF